MKKSNHSRPALGTELLFSMILFLVFALCSVFTILIGSKVYENIRMRDDRTFHNDTALAYITNKIRQADREDMAVIREENGIPVLILSMEAAGSVYETWIYTQDGILKELFTEQGSGLDTDDGLTIMDCTPVSFAFEYPAPGRKILTVTLDGRESAKILLRSRQKGGTDR